MRRIRMCVIVAIFMATMTAAWALSVSDIKGGLVVHVGCGDGKFTAELLANDGCLVHGLDADGANVAKAREHIQSLGLYGKVSVDRLTGGVPGEVNTFFRDGVTTGLALLVNLRDAIEIVVSIRSLEVVRATQLDGQ